jgi:hypothetical protein
MAINIFNVCTLTDETIGGLDRNKEWMKLRDGSGVVAEFYPLTVKALYIVGIILGSCRSIDILLQEGRLISETYFPAYAIYASIINLFGRCITGNDQIEGGSNEDIRAGFKWLAKSNLESYNSIPSDCPLVTTKTPWGTLQGTYTIAGLLAMRHFAAHGQADSKNLPVPDYNILGEMPGLLANGIESYLTALESNEELCNRLAKAHVKPYLQSGIFSFLFTYPGLRESFATSVGNAIRKLDWTYKSTWPLFNSSIESNLDRL